MPATNKPPARDLADYHLNQIHEFLAEDRAMLFETRDSIKYAFAKARKVLIASNNLHMLKATAHNNISFFDAQQPKIDTSGWSISNEALREAFDEIDYSHSIIYDVYMNAIQLLKNTETLPKMQITQPMSADGQLQPNRLTQEQPGFFERLTGKIGNAMKPSWAKKGDMALSLVTGLFDYMNHTRERWEVYRATHWDNISKAIDWDGGEFVYELIEELEALDDCSMRTIWLVDVGYRHLVREQRHDLLSIGKSMVESHQLSLNQMQQVPYMMPQQPLRTDLVNRQLSNPDGL